MWTETDARPCQEYGLVCSTKLRSEHISEVGERDENGLGARSVGGDRVGREEESQAGSVEVPALETPCFRSRTALNHLCVGHIAKDTGELGAGDTRECREIVGSRGKQVGKCKLRAGLRVECECSEEYVAVGATGILVGCEGVGSGVGRGEGTIGNFKRDFTALVEAHSRDVLW